MRERRLDPTTGEWTTFAPRGDGARERAECHLCAVVDAVAGHDPGARNGAIVVLDEEEGALASEPPAPNTPTTGLYAVEPARGAAELVLYATSHGTTLAGLDREHVARLIEVWADRYADLGSRDEVSYVFIFEERADGDGTLGHPHGHVHGYPEIPPRVRRELEVAVTHLAEHGTCVFCDVVGHERAEGFRLVAENRSFLAFVPFAARFPYEVHVIAHRHATSLLDLTDPERDALAELLVAVVRAYVGLFGDGLRYLMAVHQAPTDDGHWLAISHFHVEFVPLRPPGGGLEHGGAELGVGAFVNETTPEQAAAELREALERGGGA